MDSSQHLLEEIRLHLGAYPPWTMELFSIQVLVGISLQIFEVLWFNPAFKARTFQSDANTVIADYVIFTHFCSPVSMHWQCMPGRHAIT